MEPPVASRVTAYAGCGLSLLTLRCQRRDNHPLSLLRGASARGVRYRSTPSRHVSLYDTLST